MSSAFPSLGVGGRHGRRRPFQLIAFRLVAFACLVLHVMASAAYARPVALATRPDFTPPARPAPNRNVNLELALASLKTAFEAFGKVQNVNFGVFRTKANDDMAAAASDVLNAIKTANGQLAARGRGRGVAPPPPQGR
jgi:hypothetical protein